MSTANSHTQSYLDWFLKQRKGLWIIFCLVLTTFVTGTAGYMHYQIDGEETTFSNALYHTAQLFIMHAPHFGLPVPATLEIARWLGALTTGFTLFNVVFLLYHTELSAILLKYKRDHVIVCGMGSRGMLVVESFRRKNLKVVAIEKHPDPEVVERLRRLRIPLVVGDAMQPGTLDHARLKKASKIYIMGPEDPVNISIAISASGILKEPLSEKIFLHIDDDCLPFAMQSNHIKYKKSFSYINVYGTVADQLIARDLPLDHDGIGSDDRNQAHLVILGFGKMGRSLAVRAAQLGQFANQKPLRISIIDQNANKNKDLLRFHYRFIDQTASLSFHELSIQSPEARELIQQWCEEPDQLVSIVFTFSDPSLVLDSAFSLIPAMDRPNVRVAARIKDSPNLHLFFPECKTSSNPQCRLTPFGLEDAFEILLNPEKDEAGKFARDIHKAYVSLARDFEKSDPENFSRKFSSDSLKDWNELDPDFRESSRQQALHLGFKVRAAGYEIVDKDDPRQPITSFLSSSLHTSLAIMEHNRWMAERRVFNWTWGETSNPARRINKNLVAWEKLSDATKQYDYDAVERIPKMLEGIRKKMVKKP